LKILLLLVLLLLGRCERFLMARGDAKIVVFESL
jgi:hypothetical protein